MRRWGLVLGLVFWTLSLAAPSWAEEVVLLTDAPEAPLWGEPWLEAFSAQIGGAKLVGVAPWSPEPTQAELDGAAANHKRGVDAFLALEMRDAAEAFGQASERYEALIEAHPFSEAALVGMARNAFYQAWAQLESSRRRDARKSLTELLTRYPGLTPDPGVFPPAFRKEVDAVGKSLQRERRLVKLTLEVRPGGVMVRAGGQLVRASEGRVELTLAQGPQTIRVGWPGVAVQTLQVDLKGDDERQVNLLEWPQGLPRTAPGVPAQTPLLDALHAERARWALWVTSGDSLGLPGGQVIFAHRLGDGKLTAVLGLPSGSGGRLTTVLGTLSASMSSPGLEVMSVDRASGRAEPDDALEERVLALIDDVVVEDPELPGDDTDSVRLGLDLGTGLGLATQVSDPGLAPTFLVVRPELGFILGERWDLGLAARVQVTDFSLMGEGFARWRGDAVWVRGGVAVGEITHRILVTENRPTSTEGLVGPVLGLELPFGAVRVGASLVAPLAPRPTIHGDVWLGVSTAF